MKKRKRNRTNSFIITEGYIKSFFGSEIGRILSPSTHSIQNCQIAYVHHQEAETVLEDCLVGDPLKDKSLVFTGLTGSGKTTILRHVFDLETNASKVHIKDNRIIIPVDFNRSHSTAQDSILSSLRVAVNAIVTDYGIDFPDLDNENFYKYIEARRPDFLHLNPMDNPSTPHKEKMKLFLKTVPTAFASFQLQYVMDQESCNLQLIVLIVDNIEAFVNSKAKVSKERYLSPVIEAFKLANCIEQRGESTKWCFNMIIACRHHIWRIMKGEFIDNSEENPLLQSYVTTEKPYDLVKPVDLNSIVQRREDVFSKKQRNPEKWKDAVKVVNTVLQKMENSIGDFVMQLELKDIRKSMSRMQSLILHRSLQKKSDEEIIASGAFQIDSVEQFDLTRVNLIKTLGLDNRKYYADSNSIIPNLLMNNQHDGLELHVLLTLNYFLLQCDYMEPSWDNPISIPEFYKMTELIFGYSDSEIKNPFEECVVFLIKHRLLLRSADQPQNEVPGLSLAEMKKIEHVYTSGAAVRLWEELGKSSALFQLFLDDIWLDEKLDYFEENGNDIEHCAKYLEALIQVEEKIYISAKNMHSEMDYIEIFGTIPICKQLASGLISSLETIVESGYFGVQNRIREAMQTLQKVKKLFNELMEWELERREIKDNI